MRLAELQSAFQDAILGEAREILTAILPSRQLDSAARFAVYADAYRARLAEFLANDYPVLRLVLGDEDFGALAAAYIDATPSPHRNARWYAQDLPDFLPDFLRGHAPWCDMRALADLAALERALADAFDAADAPRLDASALAAIAAEDQPKLCFEFSPNLALLSLLEGTTASYEAAIEGLAAPMPEPGGEETVLIWRDGSLEPFYRLLEADEALALAAARSGAKLDEICGLLCLRHDAEAAAGQAALFLARWFGDGLVTGLCCR